MDVYERKMVEELIINSITKEQFISNFTVNIRKNPDYILQLLQIAYNEKNAGDVDFLLYLILAFNLITQDYIDLLCKLMDAPWHYMHEDIAAIFQSFEFPEGSECLYRAALSHYEYLTYDEALALAVKCIWALGAIDTIDSKKKLELLTQSDNEIIRKNAIYQLN